jgi:hypothetical protein
MKSMFILLFGLLTFPAFALDDTIANREQQADRYFAERSLKTMCIDSLTDGDKDDSEAHQKKMRLIKYIDWQAIDKGMKEAAIKTYTADELKALADMCATPAGCSALKKTDDFGKAITPILKLEITRAIAKENLDRLDQK